MKRFLSWGICGMAILMAFGTARFAATASAARPNFVFVLVDDLGWMDFGCYD